MNKTNKNADAKSLRAYYVSDKRYLIQSAERIRFVKRTIRRMERRVNKTLCVMEAQ